MRKLIRPSQEELEQLKKQYADEQPSNVKRLRIPPDKTGKEVLFITDRISSQKQVVIKLKNGRELKGFIEYYDLDFIRLTPKQGPNEFIFKKDILFLYDE